MTDARANGRPAARPSRGADDGWGPSTATYSTSAGSTAAGSTSAGSTAGGARAAGRNASPSRTAAPRPYVRHDAPPRPVDASPQGWSPAGPLPRDQQRANRDMERQLRKLQTASARRDAQPQEQFDTTPQRGVRGWVALLVLVVIAAIGGVIDTVGSFQVNGGFNIGIIVASVVAILIVRRSDMFPVVIAPPIVYSIAAVFQLYLRSGGLHDKKIVFDAAANYLVYGFPAIAAATAAVLIVAGLRMVLRR